MKKAIYIGIIAVVLAGCKTTSQAPLDDAYYWPEKSTKSAESVPTSQNLIAPSAAANPSTPDIQVIHQQDTTVTIRVKK